MHYVKIIHDLLKVTLFGTNKQFLRISIVSQRQSFNFEAWICKKVGVSLQIDMHFSLLIKNRHNVI